MQKPTVKEILEGIIDEMLGTGILWPEVNAQFEKLYIIKALVKADGSVKGAAELMGVHRNTVSKKIREYDIDRQELRENARD